MNLIQKKYDYYFKDSNYVYQFHDTNWIMVLDKYTDTITDETEEDINIHKTYNANKLHILFSFNKFNPELKMKYENMSDSIKKHYNGNGNNTLCVEYYKSPEVPFYMNLINNDLYSGMYMDWYINGELSSTGNLLAGKQNGLWQKYHKNGKTMEKGQYILGKKQLVWKTFYENGNVISQGEYMNDLKTGLWTFFHENGTVNVESLYKSNLLHGNYVQYNDKHVKIIENNYVNNKKDGLYTEYYDSGNEKVICTYKSNNLQGIYTEYYDDPSKIIKYQTEYNNNIKSGKETTYYDNKQKRLECIVKNNKKNGLCIEWWLNGMCKSQGNYVDDSKNGLWSAWDEFGNKIFDEHHMGDQIIQSIEQDTEREIDNGFILIE